MKAPGRATDADDAEAIQAQGAGEGPAAARAVAHAIVLGCQQGLYGSASGDAMELIESVCLYCPKPKHNF